MKTSPYFFVYKKEAILLLNIYLPPLHLSQESQGRSCLIIQSQIDNLLKLEEEMMRAKEKFNVHQNWIKCWFDKKSKRNKCFSVGDLVLKWDKSHEEKGNNPKFQSLWIGP